MIAIHNRKDSFSERWISYCETKKIPFIEVNCCDNNIMSILKANKCKGLMWHWDQNDYKAALFARQLTLAIEKTGVKIFPDMNTAFHFDDKLGQKYLLEAIHAPIVNTYIFYSKKEALNWIENIEFPKVFKLRGGASSVNVKLIKTKTKAKKLINKAFGRGFSPINKISRLKDRIWLFKYNLSFHNFRGVLSGIIRLVIPLELEKFSSKEIGYVYFQDFIPSNTFDTRTVVVGGKCFAIRRYCRKDDFRASGSGIDVGYEKELFDEKMIKESFRISKKLKTQSLALDFIWDNRCIKVVEISYCFAIGKVYDDCHGYWDDKLVWHDKKVNPQKFIIEDFITSLENV